MESVRTYTWQLDTDKDIIVGNVQIESAEKAKDIINLIFDINNAKVEKFGMIGLGRDNYVAGVNLLAVGKSDSVKVTKQDIVKCSLGTSSNAIIIFHNHPGGDPSPSAEDIKYTRSLKKYGEESGFYIVDHIIVAGDKYYSMREHKDVEFIYDLEKAILHFD